MIEVHPQLFDAAREGNLQTVQQIVNSWPAEDRRYGYTVRSPSWAVTIALRAGHADVARWLLEHGGATPYYVKIYLVYDAETNGPIKPTPATQALLDAHNLLFSPL